MAIISTDCKPLIATLELKKGLRLLILAAARLQLWAMF